MDGARYLENGKLTIFKNSGVFYARIRLASQKYFRRSPKTNLLRNLRHLTRDDGSFERFSSFSSEGFDIAVVYRPLKEAEIPNLRTL